MLYYHFVLRPHSSFAGCPNNLLYSTGSSLEHVLYLCLYSFCQFGIVLHFCLAFMILTLWKFISQLFCRITLNLNFVWFSSVQSLSHVRLCDPMNRSTSGLPVHHHLPEFIQIHAHWVSDAIQPSHSLSFPSPPAPNPSQQKLEAINVFLSEFIS